MKYLCIKNHYQLNGTELLYKEGLVYDINPFTMSVGEFSNEETHYVTIGRFEKCYLSDRDVLECFILYAKYRENKINEILND